MGRIGDTRAVPTLISRLLDDGQDLLKYGEPSYVAEVAAYALKRIGTSEAIAAFASWPDMLLAEIQKSEYWRCYSPIVMLGHLKEPRAVPRLVELLNGQADKLAQTAPEAYGNDRQDLTMWMEEVIVAALKEVGTYDALAAVEKYLEGKE